jgi:hypothetical protein
MGLLLDDVVSVVAADLTGDLVGAGDQAYDCGTRQQRQRTPQMRVGNGVVIAIEAHVRRLARHNRAHHLRFERMRREREQSRLLVGEDLATVRSRCSGCGRWWAMSSR